MIPSILINVQFLNLLIVVLSMTASEEVRSIVNDYNETLRNATDEIRMLNRYSIRHLISKSDWKIYSRDYEGKKD